MNGDHHGGLPRVLLVDDDARLLAGLRERLRTQFLIETALDGAAALALLRLGPPFDAVVADMRMPGISGLDLLRSVRAEFPEVARVMLTGDDSAATARQAINDGAVSRLIAKPCHAVDLVGAIDAALARSATDRIALHAVEGAVLRQNRVEQALALGMQLAAPMAGVRAAAVRLRDVGVASQQLALAELDHQTRRLGAMFDRFLQHLYRLGDDERSPSHGNDS